MDSMDYSVPFSGQTPGFPSIHFCLHLFFPDKKYTEYTTEEHIDQVLGHTSDSKSANLIIDSLAGNDMQVGKFAPGIRLKTGLSDLFFLLFFLHYLKTTLYKNFTEILRKENLLTKPLKICLE